MLPPQCGQTGGGQHWSRRDWPIQGGECEEVGGERPSLVITGHEDGKVVLEKVPSEGS